LSLRAPPSGILHPSLIESYLWLEFGVRLGYFPFPEAKDVAIEFHFPIFHWLGFSIDKFPEAVRIRMEGVRKNKTYFDQVEQSTNDEQNTLFWDAYQFLELLSSRFNHNKSFWCLYLQLPEIKKEEFKLYAMSHPKYPDDFWNQQNLTNWEGDQSASDFLALVKGFLTALEYMATQQRVLVDLREALASHTGYYMAFVRRLEEIERWKLNFKGSPFFKENFLNLASLVGQHIAKEAEPTGIDGKQASEEFITYTANLIKFWEDRGSPAPQSFRVARRSASAS
jgi:hypothetical protein